MIDYGIVGIGGFAATWVRCLAQLEREGIARLAAAVVRRPERYQAQVAQLQAAGCSIYASLEAMLADGQGSLDVIGVPTGIAYHEPMAVSAMEAGFDVLVEKPLAGTVQEVQHLHEVEQRTGRWCAVGYQWLYSPTTRWIASRLGDGGLGAVREARTMIVWPRDSAYYSRNAWAGALRHNNRWILDGPATNATAHYVTQALYYARASQGTPRPIESVRAELYRARDIASYDTSCIEVRLAGGARVLHVVSHAVAEQHDPVIHLECEHGTVDWAADGDVAAIRYADGREERFANPAFDDLQTLPLRQTARVAAGDEPFPTCGLSEAGSHVLAINLAFESSQGVHTIPSDGTRILEPSGIVAVREMEGALAEAYASGAMLSDLGLPWTRSTEPVSAAGYDRFPRSPALLRALGC